MTLAWSLPQFTSSCDLIGFALFMNDGQGSDVLTEIDSALVRGKPFMTTLTTSAPTIVGATYIF
jgi:hypothetical protein